MPESISKRSLGTAPARSTQDPNTASIKERRSSVPKGNSTRGFTPPGAKKAGGNGKAIESTKGRTVAGRPGKTIRD